MHARWIALAALLPCAAAAEPVPAQAAAPATGGFKGALLDTTSILAWPLQLESADLLLLGGAALATVGLLRADIRLYSRLDNLHWTLHRRSLFNYTLLAGDGLVDLAVMGAFAFGDEKAQRTSVTGIEALLSAGATSVLLKHVFRVPRPNDGAGEKRYFHRFRDDAFPSGHTMSAFATASVISSAYPTAAPFAYGTAALVGLSVMKRGWHWPSDVLAGGALGALIGQVAVRVNRRRIALSAAPGGIGVQADI